MLLMSAPLECYVLVCRTLHIVVASNLVAQESKLELEWTLGHLPSRRFKVGHLVAHLNDIVEAVR